MLGYQDLLDIGLSPDAECFQARLVAAVGKLGFGLSGGTLIRGRYGAGKASVNSFGNPPDAYLETFKSATFGMKDPLLAAMLDRDGCHTYDQHFYTAAGAGDLWDNQAAYGYRRGMAISIHEFSHAEMFSFGVDSHDALPTGEHARLELQANLWLIALHAKEAALRLFTPAPSGAPAVTEPELEALRWAADAKLVWKRGSLTVISRPGETDQQRAAARRLGARSTSQAVLRAIDGGLIDRS